jgi:hypothetical protein
VPAGKREAEGVERRRSHQEDGECDGGADPGGSHRHCACHEFAVGRARVTGVDAAVDDAIGGHGKGTGAHHGHRDEQQLNQSTRPSARVIAVSAAR